MGSSLRDELEKAIGEQEEVKDEVVDESAKADENSASETDDKQVVESESESGQDQQGSDKTGESDKEAAPGDAEPEKLTPPEHWTQADKDVFNSQTREAQTWLLDRHKAMEGDYTRQKQEVSDQAKRFDQHLEPFRPYLPQLGMTEDQLVGSLLSAYGQMLSGNARNVLLGLAQQFNVDLNEEPDPQQEQLNSVISQLDNKINQVSNHFISQSQNQVTQQLDQFASAKDEKGELQHPYFEDVIEDMTVLANAVRARGQQPDIKQLYEQAIWANPIVREKILSSQKEAEGKKAQMEAEQKRKEDQERANKAKRASASVSGDGSADTPTQGGDIRSLIENALEEQGGRV